MNPSKLIDLVGVIGSKRNSIRSELIEISKIVERAKQDSILRLVRGRDETHDGILNPWKKQTLLSILVVQD